MKNETWTWQRPGCRVNDAKGRKVADVATSYCGEAELNRRGYAIAAVPQLVKALEAVDEWLMEGFDDEDAENSGYNIQFRKALKLTREALAAATTPEDE
jgi:hypothetical protein